MVDNIISNGFNVIYAPDTAETGNPASHEGEGGSGEDVSDGLADTVPQSADTVHFYLDSSPAL